jgi:hypothetical protein
MIQHSMLTLTLPFAVEAVHFATPLSDVTLKEVGLRAEFSCIVSKPGLKATWLFNGDTVIKRGEKYDVQSAEDGTHTLVVEVAVAEDVGQYTVSFEEAGVQSTAKLNIHGTSSWAIRGDEWGFEVRSRGNAKMACFVF